MSSLSQLNLINQNGNNFDINFNNSNLISFSNSTSSISYTGNPNINNFISNNIYYRTISFINNGTLTISGSPMVVDILVVGGGGGGGGGNYSGGGGGGGDVIYSSSVSMPIGTYTITVGAGGNSRNNGQNSSIVNNTNSTIFSIYAAGGGGGGYGNDDENTTAGLAGNVIGNSAGGGGGGGGLYANQISGGSGNNVSGDGGAGIGPAGGGGGGSLSSANGGNGGNGYIQSGNYITSVGGNGGSGTQNSITGILLGYGGGGGGTSYGKKGGIGIDGGGYYNTSGNANRGGGGGGGGLFEGLGGNGCSGGSGVVIIRFPIYITDSFISFNSTTMSINTNLGIGNTLPFAPLWIGNPDINNSSGALVISQNNNNITKRNFKIGFDNNFNFCIGDYGTSNYNINNWKSQFLINSNGNVAIGITNPSLTDKLTVEGTIKATSFGIGTSIYGIGSTGVINGTVLNIGTTSENIITCGKISIGTAATNTSLNVNGIINMNSGSVALPTLNNNSIIGGVGDRVVLNPGTSGVYPHSIGYNTNTIWFSGPTNTSYVWYSNLNSNMFLDGSGNLTIHNDITAFNSASDLKLKENIKSVNINCLNLINQLKPVEFTWKDIELVPSNKRNKKDYGFIAQDVEKIIPSLINDNNNSYKGIKYDKITTYLVKAIQELNNKFDNLSNMIKNK